MSAASGGSVGRAPARRVGGDQHIPRPATWSPGRPSPWQPRGGVARRLSVDEVLASVPPHDPGRGLTPAFDDSRPSAVLVAMFDGPEGAELLLTRRSRHLSHHGGEVSFPGGRMDPGESPRSAALREAHEEVGLDPDLVTVCGELDHLNTLVSRSYIVPVVGRLDGRPEVSPSPAEVDRVLFVPVVELTRPGTHREERWGAAPDDWLIHFFELDDETIWGATGRMLHQLLCLAYGLPSLGTAC